MKKIKKILLIMILSLMCFICINCSFENSSENSTNTEIEVGKTIQLISSLDDCTWESADERIAVINNEGLVKGVASGVVKIYAKTEEKVEELSLTVTEDTVDPILFIRSKQTLNVSEEVQLECSIINSKETFTFTYSSNDNDVCTVSQSGVIKGLACGIATITVNAVGSVSLSKEFLVYIKETNSSGEIINNVINNTTYEITGNIDLTMINSTVCNIVEKYKASIVGVSNYKYQQSGFQRTLVEYGVGTGFIFKSVLNGDVYTYYVLTNNHVISGYDKLKIYFGYEDEYVDATFVNTNASLDLAVVSFTSKEKYELLPLGDTTEVKDGDFAIAIGNSNGYEYFGSVTFGVISYCNRELVGETATFLQHDVAINPGNSGGPLLNIKGEVIGINTLKIVDSEVDNMGFSISIDTVKSFLTSIDIA